MMNRRRTVAIKALIEEVNRLNRESTCTSEERRAVNSFLERILMDANVYVGFNLLSADELVEAAKGMPPGVIWGHNPETGKRDNKFNEYPDESRRTYYIHPHLRNQVNHE